jgi:hypothetical protein
MRLYIVVITDSLEKTMSVDSLSSGVNPHTEHGLTDSIQVHSN